uniref:hypothetical protein n=1 Tax=Vibrio coralliirubri TaxID=1516159 RepID=UPI0012FFA7CF
PLNYATKPSHAGILTQQQYDEILNTIITQFSISIEMLIQVSCSRYVDDPEQLLGSMEQYVVQLFEEGKGISQIYKKESRNGLDS